MLRSPFRLHTALVSQVVYFARTDSSFLDEGFKDHAIYLDDATEPAARGSFEAKHGPQAVSASKKPIFDSKQNPDYMTIFVGDDPMWNFAPRRDPNASYAPCKLDQMY
ncbi:MAG: hypothetical protein Q4D38_00825 [Planctomycetia bacterium]|nr:hypothetical protein [Planctomycetia bacterium]